MPACFICNNYRFIKTKVSDYIKCSLCGHESKIGEPQEHFIVNDVLSLKEVYKYDILEKFRASALSICVNEYDFLLDIGSSSGKFLFHNRKKFNRHLGIEVTKSCIDFSRQKLGLHIANDIDEVGEEKISVATFWHSLEHIPFVEIDKMISKIACNSTNGTAMIIAVPNANSLLYRIFGKYFSYYDTESHVHQFSYTSLKMLLKKYSFEEKKIFFSFAYSAFGYLQTLLNVANIEHNFLYYYLKRGNTFQKKKTTLIIELAYNFMLCGIFALPAILGTMYDFFFRKKSAVLTICFQTKKHST